MKKELWHFMILGDAGDNTGVYGNFYAHGEHLGDALQKVFDASLSQSFGRPRLIEAEFYSSLEMVHQQEELIRINESVFMRDKTHSFEIDPADEEFIAPVGIIKTSGEDEFDFEMIQEKFCVNESGGTGNFGLEVVASQSNLVGIFSLAIASLPNVEGLGIYIKDHWGNGKTELWANQHFTDAFSLTTFLKTHAADLLETGFLDLVVRAKDKTRLLLSEHKTISLNTKNETAFQFFIEQLLARRFSQTEKLYSLENGFHHFHYRPAKSLTRTDFKQWLQENNFELLEEWSNET